MSTTRTVVLVALASLLTACSGKVDTPPDYFSPGDSAAGDSHAGDSAPGDSEPACEDECSAGSQSCDGGNAYRVCGQYDDDPCLEMSAPIGCSYGTQCTGGSCRQTCSDECQSGATQCDAGGSVVTCGNYDLDPCRELGAATTCPSGYHCDQGACLEDSIACTDECQSGTTVCSGDAVRVCGQHDLDNCLDLSLPAACNAGQVCQDGTCITPCIDGCPSDGLSECVGNAFRSCSDIDFDGCLEWSTVTTCVAPNYCSNGACSATCTDECATPGQLLCNADNSGVVVCGDYDNDPCTDRSSASPCPANNTCQSGTCVPVCADDCSAGDPPRCFGSDTVQTCADYDTDPCLEWGGNVACPSGDVCTGGACDTACTDACSPSGTTACVSGQDATQTCGQYDLDSCLDWSAASACQSYEVCNAGQCETGTAPNTVLINEILVNAAGTDSAPGNNLFIELWGTAGQSLDGFELVGVNGTNGADYNSILLDGEVIAADGYYVIAHPDGDPTLVAVADLTNSRVDLQNGPDSLQIRWHGTTIDAVGYGSFGSGEVFAGEMTAATGPGQGESLTRDAQHSDSGDNSADFYVPVLPSPRAAPPACSNECTAGAQRCAGQQIETCVTDADGDLCTEWSAPAACPTSGDVCDGTVNQCVTPSCSDECTAATSRCNGTQIENCVTNADADPCLEWSTPSTCPVAGEECNGGSCSQPCTNECPSAGATQCNGDQVQTCNDYDVDACLEWSAASACGNGETCVTDSCQATNAPEVVLIAPQGTLQTTQGAIHRILADATPAAGRTITRVDYYVSGILRGSTTSVPHEYYYTVPASTPTGTALSIQARATDNQGVAGASAFAYLDVRNDLPLANFTATVTNTSTATVDAGASADTETASADLEVRWDWTNDGTWDTGYSTTKILTHDFGASGTFTIGMQVRDAVGQTSLSTREITFTDIQYIGGQTVTTTLWYGTVIITGDVTVGAGETLTIANGTQILFVHADTDSDGVGDYTLTVNGVIDANGTAASPVVFSGQDATAKVPGGWDRIILAGSSPSTLDNVVVEYAYVGIDIRNASVLNDVTVRSTSDDCIRVDNGDGASLTNIYLSDAGDDGIVAFNGATGVSIDGLRSAQNAEDGIEVYGGAVVTITDTTVTGNGQHGVNVDGSSTRLNLSDSVVEDNDGIGISIMSGAGGTIERNQIRRNGGEGIGIQGSSGGQPNPVVNYNNIYSNAASGSTVAGQGLDGTTISASRSSSGTSTSTTYTAPSGMTIWAIYVSYSESDYNYYNYIRGRLLNASTGSVIQEWSTGASTWVYLPAGVTAVQVQVSSNSSSYSGNISAQRAMLSGSGGASDVSVATTSGAIDMRYNYLGTFPDVLSRVSLGQHGSTNLQGFVGTPYDPATWDRSIYKATPIDSETWSGTVYITGDLTIDADDIITVAAGTQILFVDHDQDSSGVGDFHIDVDGQLNLTGVNGNEVVISGAGSPTGDAFERIILGGVAVNSSTWSHVTVANGYDAIEITGYASLSDVSVAGGGGDGIGILDGGGVRALTDITVTAAAGRGVLIDNGDNSTLTRVTSQDNGGYGLEIRAGSTNVDVGYLTSRRNAASGVSVSGGSTPAITDSTIRDNTDHGVDVSSASPTLDYNLITYNGGAGIAYEGSGGGTAEYNVVKFNDDAGVYVVATNAGSPAPTVQYSNIYGNAVVQTSMTAQPATSGTLSASRSSSGTSSSSAYTAPSGSVIRAAYVSYSESDYNYYNYIRGRLINASSGSVIQEWSTGFSGWVFLPAGVTSLNVQVSSNSSSYSGSISSSSLLETSISTTEHYELSAGTLSGTTTAKFNYWTPNIGEVPTKVSESRSGSVDYTGFTGAEYTGLEVGPRP